MAIRPLQPIGMWDEFRVAWRAGDTRPATAACVRVVLETCSAERSAERARLRARRCGS